jgi:hypothetical protein
MKPSSASYLLILRQPGTGGGPSPEKMREIMARFADWMDGLHAKDMVLGTNGLEATGRMLRGPIGETVVTDGPYVEAKEVVGGYVLLQARSLEEATEAAKQCPGLDYGMGVEVRAVKSRR